MGSSEVAPVSFHGCDAARVYTSLLCNKSMDAEAQLVEASGRSELAEDVNMQLQMDSTRNGVEEEYMREDPCTIFSAFHDSGMGPVSQPRLSPIHHLSQMFCQREGRLRVPRKPVEGWCRQTCSMLFKRRTSFEHREPR